VPTTSAALMPNLLLGGPATTTANGTGTHIGDGLPPIPSKLAAKIRRGEFIEMYELLPEIWAEPKEGEKPASRARAKKRVLDLNVWLQSFALYVGVLVPQSRELMAYLINTVKASQEFEGSAWAVYDAAYRRQAAATGHSKWSQVNPSLYSVCFTGKAKKTTRCERCLSASHRSEDCSLPAEEDPDIGKRLKAIESAVVALTQSGPMTASRGRSMDICRKFNQKQCSFLMCKYVHLCASCRGNHPAVDCPMGAIHGEQGVNVAPLGPVRRPRTSPPSNPY